MSARTTSFQSNYQVRNLRITWLIRLRRNLRKSKIDWIDKEKFWKPNKTWLKNRKGKLNPDKLSPPIP
jgi:hypothetical protein